MAQLKFGSAGVTAREIDISGPVAQQPVGIPAGIIGTSLKGPAFVPITVGNLSDWYAKFGQTDGKKFGPLAVVEWLRNAQAVTYLKVLGVGDGLERDSTTGKVASAGFFVGKELPDATGSIARNPYAVDMGDPGRLFFLGCFMSDSLGGSATSTFFRDAGLQGAGSVTSNVSSSLPIIRGVLMAPSGVYLTLSSSVAGVTNTPPDGVTPTSSGVVGSTLGTVVLSGNGIPKQEFVLYLNGHIGADVNHPNVITASFDPTTDNYFAKVFNTDPTKIQESGHYLYANWDIHPSLATVTGSGLVSASLGAAVNGGSEPSAFILASSQPRDEINGGTAFVPNYESFEDRFSHAVSPWVVSQKFGGVAQNLFRLHTLDDGAGNSTRFKVSIENLTVSNDPLNRYGSFDVVLRDWMDRDQDKKTLPNEVFRGVNLDPSSDRYIAKIIGDIHAYYDFDREESEQKLVIEGNYQNNSNYVRVEVHPGIENGFVDPTAMPMGFRGIDHLVTSGSSPLQAFGSPEATALNGVSSVSKRSITPPVPFRKKITTSEEWSATEQANSKFYWGVQFEHPKTLAKKNEGVISNGSLKSFAKFFPGFALDKAKFLTGSNVGQPDTVQWGIIDADRFCNNFFTLENVQVVTGSNGLADPSKWKLAVYCRNGSAGTTDVSNIASVSSGDETKIRAFKVEDIPSNKQFAKFSFLMQGGFDGVNIFDKDESEINNNAVTADMESSGRDLEKGPSVRTYLKAIEVMKEHTNADIQLLAIPGIRHEIVTDAAILAVEERFDALYIMDVQQKDETDSVVTTDSQLPSVTRTAETFVNRSVDSSFAASYFPDVLYRDPTGVNMFVPPSVVVMGALSLNDKLGHPWFAPAGFTRGALPEAALEARVRLSQGDMDKLYDISVNPIVAFAGATTSGTNPKGGVVVWGQKTLQVAASALDRVNVRRLLIDIRRQVREIAQTVLFEPNREATLARFSAAVTPRLQRIQTLSGLERFKVVIDSSTTTQDDILNNTIRGKIFVQPTKSIEFVSLDFVVTNNITQI